MAIVKLNSDETWMRKAIALAHQAEQEGEVPVGALRSEERRVGKECRSRWSPYH